MLAVPRTDVRYRFYCAACDVSHNALYADRACWFCGDDAQVQRAA